MASAGAGGPSAGSLSVISPAAAATAVAVAAGAGAGAGAGVDAPPSSPDAVGVGARASGSANSADTQTDTPTDNSGARVNRGQSTGGSDVLLIGFDAAPRAAAGSTATSGSRVGGDANGTGHSGGHHSGNGFGPDKGSADWTATNVYGHSTIDGTADGGGGCGGGGVDDSSGDGADTSVRTGCCSASVAVTAVGAWAAFVDSLIFALPIAFLSTHLRSQHAYAARDTGYVYAVWAAAALLATPLFLRLLPSRAAATDRSPRATAADARMTSALALLGPLLTLGGCLVFAFAPGAVAFYVGRGAQGVGSVATWLSALTLVSAFSGCCGDAARAGARLGYVLFASALGTLTGPVVGGALYDLQDLRDQSSSVAAAASAVETPNRDFRLPLYVAIAAAGTDLCARVWLLAAYPPAHVLTRHAREQARRRATSAGVPPDDAGVRPPIRPECAQQLVALQHVIDKLCRRVAQTSKAGNQRAVAAVLPDVREVESLLLEARQDLALNASELMEHVVLLHAVQRLLAAHDPTYALPDDARASAPISPVTRTRASSSSSSSMSAAAPPGAVALTSIEVAPAAGGGPSRRLSADGSVTAAATAPPANTPASAAAVPATPPPTLGAVLCASGTVWCALLWCALSGFYTASLQPTLPLYVMDRFGASTSVVGLLFVVLAAGFAAGSPVAALLIEHGGGRSVAMLVGGAGVAVTYCVFGQAESLEGVFGTAFFFGVAQSVALGPCLPAFAEAWAAATGSLPFAHVFLCFNAVHVFGLAAGAIVQPYIVSATAFDDAQLLSATGVVAGWLLLLVVTCARRSRN